MQIHKAKRSASRSTVGCARACAEPHGERREFVIYSRRQTMDENVTAFVGVDAHAESTAIGVAEAGRAAPRFSGASGRLRGRACGLCPRAGTAARVINVKW